VFVRDNHPHAFASGGQFNRELPLNGHFSWPRERLRSAQWSTGKENPMFVREPFEEKSPAYTEGYRRGVLDAIIGKIAIVPNVIQSRDFMRAYDEGFSSITHR